MRVIKFIRYGFCMISLWAKSFKFNKIKKKFGEEEAFKICTKSIFKME